MSKLREIQEQFARHLQGLPTNPDIAKQVKFNQLNNVNRLQVYQNNFRLSLTSNLAAIYPVVEKLVGDKFFKYCCHEFIKNHPSEQGNLHEYGSELAQFLTDFEAAQSLLYLPDMARFEWAYHQVFHEASANKLDLQLLQQVEEQDYSRIIFSLHPATRLMKSKFPLVKIWQANQENEPDSIELNTKDYFFLIGRRNKENIFQTLELIDFDFLNLIAAGLTLGDISERLLDKHDEAVLDLNQLLIKHVSTENICNFEISSEPLEQSIV